MNGNLCCGGKFASTWNLFGSLVKKLVDGGVDEKNKERSKLERLYDAYERNH